MAQRSFLAELLFKIGFDSTAFAKGMASLQKNLKQMSETMSKYGRELTTSITLPMLAIGGAALKMGMDAVESENLFNTSMGSMADAARGWSVQVSQSLGLNEFEVRRNTGLFYAMFESMKLGKQDSYDLATSLTQLSYDLSSFYNISQQDALEKLRSGIMGEAEPLKALGIAITETTTQHFAWTHGIAENGKQLTEQQKVMARHGQIMEATGKAQGDLARTMDSPTNQLRLFGNQVKQAGIELGIALIPMLQELFKWFAPLIERLKEGVRWFAGLSDEHKHTIVTIALIVAAIGPALLAIGKVISIISTVIGVVRTLGAALQFLAANPVGIVIMAIGLLILAGIWLYNNWDKVKFYALTAWGAIKTIIFTTIAVILEKYADFIGIFNEKQAKMARDAAKVYRDKADEEKGIIKDRAEAYFAAQKAEEDAEKKRQQDEQDKLKSAAEAADKYKAIDYSKVQFSDELAKDAKDKKVKYLDEFETEFNRTRDRMLDAYQHEQADETTTFKRGQDDRLDELKIGQGNEKTENDRALEDKKVAFDRALDEEKTTYERAQEDKLGVFKRAQSDEIDALHDRYDEERAMIDVEYRTKIDALRVQKDAIRATQEEADEKKRLADLNDRIAVAEKDVAKARLTGNADKIAQAEGKLADARTALSDHVTQQVQKAEEKRIDNAIEALRTEQDARKKASQAQEKLDEQAMKDKQAAELTDFQRKQADAKAHFEQDQADRKLRHEQELADLKTAFDQKQAEALLAYQRAQEDELTDWNTAQDRRLTAYKLELEDLKSSFEDKLALQKEYLGKKKALEAAMEATGAAALPANATTLSTPKAKSFDPLKLVDTIKALAAVSVTEAAKTLARMTGESIAQATANVTGMMASVDTKMPKTSVGAGTSNAKATAKASPATKTAPTSTNQPIIFQVGEKKVAEAIVKVFAGGTLQPVRAM